MWNIDPQTGKLEVVSFCKDVDVNDLAAVPDPNTGVLTWRVGSISSHTSGWTEGIIGAAAAFVATAP
jgi:hypothetical protein